MCDVGHDEICLSEVRLKCLACSEVEISVRKGPFYNVKLRLFRQTRFLPIRPHVSFLVTSLGVVCSMQCVHSCADGNGPFSSLLLPPAQR